MNISISSDGLSNGHILQQATSELHMFPRISSHVNYFTSSVLPEEHTAIIWTCSWTELVLKPWSSKWPRWLGPMTIQTNSKWLLLSPTDSHLLAFSNCQNLLTLNTSACWPPEPQFPYLILIMLIRMSNSLCTPVSLVRVHRMRRFCHRSATLGQPPSSHPSSDLAS